MIRNVIGGFTNIDSGFGRTIVELLYRPGYLIRDFIGGKRVVYFRPFQALFVLASLYIIFAQLIGPDPLQKKPIGEELTRQEYRMDQKEISSLQKENKAVGSDRGEMIAERHTGRRALFYKQMRFVTEPTDGVVSRQQGCQDHQYSSHSRREYESGFPTKRSRSI